ncbi:MAG: methyltransferase domain-containing protein [Flavobacteriales bacterium]|nr:methyltransferase domain-containing protein [Flavobacteriales bacterium]
MEWFSSWFDTPYYHQLYNNRDFHEADRFMTNLLEHLKLKKGSSILDLACGKGRHSFLLNNRGYNVKGVDLSAQSIESAKQFENINLKFEVHDMRENLNEEFDAVFNLFTSFGYFDDDNDDISVLETIKNAMKPNSIAVIDFMNAERVIENLVDSETQIRGKIDFKIKRYVEKNIIHKNISFNVKKINYDFTEKVKAINLEDFKKYFAIVGLNLKDTFGNYNLDEFDVKSSDRLIMILTK